MFSLTYMRRHVPTFVRFHIRLCTLKYNQCRRQSVNLDSTLKEEPVTTNKLLVADDIYNEKYAVYKYDNGFSKQNYIQERVSQPHDKENYDDGFHVFDIGDVVAKHKTWCELLPRVKPFYAVKCRPYMVILKLMAAMGLSFDCASKSEMERVLQLGVEPSRIVYSNTRKRPSTLAYANEKGIDLMTFDDEFELAKIKRIFPSARLLLRFAIDDPSADFQLGTKFGCQQQDVKGLLGLAKHLRLNVIGVHFHIGQGSKNPDIFKDAIAHSRHIFEVAEELGFKFTVLDIGGGFPGEDLSTGLFKKYAEAVNSALDEYFPDASKVDIIAEPGTYYMRSAGTVVACVIGKRQRRDERIDSRIDDNATINYDYYVSDGVYTSLVGATLTPEYFLPQPLKDTNGISLYSGVLYGDTCCGLDIIAENCRLPELDEGDWVYFEDKGDYSTNVTYFNGFKRPYCYYAIPANCKCSSCFNAQSKQRLIDPVTINPDIAVENCDISDDELTITWDDGHITSFQVDWLSKVYNVSQTGEEDTHRILWNREKLETYLPSDVTFEEYMESEEGLIRLLTNLHKFGIAFLSGIPKTRAMTRAIGERIAPLKSSIFGEVEYGPDNTEQRTDHSFGTGYLPYHTDYASHKDPPGYSFMHYLQQAEIGGETFFCDALRTARILKEHHPDDFNALATLPVAFHKIERSVSVQCETTIFEVRGPGQDPVIIRASNDDRSVLTLSHTDANRWYTAWRKFRQITDDPKNIFYVKGMPGRGIFFDNWRLMHGRLAFKGARIFDSCNLSRDRVCSKISTCAKIGSDELI